jgi:hypothetical protein
MSSRLSDFGGVFLMLLCLSCSKTPDVPDFHFVGALLVEGECTEDKSTVAGRYQGDIVDWYNLSRQTHSRYGSVTNIDAMSRMQQFTDPHGYQPPNNIGFDNLSSNDISGDELVLNGLSGREASPGNALRATCKLAVTKRLDHLPTPAERTVARH